MLQSGTFQLCARGVRWFVDLSRARDYGVPNHNVHDAGGASRTAGTTIATARRATTRLVVNPSYAAGPPLGRAHLRRSSPFQSAPNGQRSFAVWDLTADDDGRGHAGAARHPAPRQPANRFLVQDEIVHARAERSCWWFAHCACQRRRTAISGGRPAA
jgi:hypothetical protein